MSVAGPEGLTSSCLQSNGFRAGALHHSIEQSVLQSCGAQEELLGPLLIPGDSAHDGESEVEDDNSERLDVGLKMYGCVHYRRRCRIRAPCCNEVFDCRHCHNDVKNAYELDPWKKHDLPRHEVEKVICSLCDTEQKVQQICENCGVCMGKYFCATCKFFDDDVSKEQFHCDACGICRVGGNHNFFHCERCGCCYSRKLESGHPCVENAMHHNCPVCFEYLFDSLKSITVMRCGHTMHEACMREMHLHRQYSCPICSRSTLEDMSTVWEERDREVAATPMPVSYQNKEVRILCNDCGAKTDVIFHIVGLKCPACSSYNTRQLKGRSGSSSQNL